MLLLLLLLLLDEGLKKAKTLRPEVAAALPRAVGTAWVDEARYLAVSAKRFNKWQHWPFPDAIGDRSVREVYDFILSWLGKAFGLIVWGGLLSKSRKI